jgi:dephospho-CoA kinase
MKWIGLTGGIASGKSTAAEIIRKFGFSVIDADQIAKEVVAKNTPGLRSVVDVFGSQILSADGQLDRKKLSEIVFQDKASLEKLESLLHPLIQDKVKKIRQQLADSGNKIAFYDVPLLFEKNMMKQFDQIIVVNVTQQNQIQRLKSRNNLTDEQINHRLKNQIPLSQKTKMANFVLDNNGTEADLENSIKELLKKLNPTA